MPIVGKSQVPPYGGLPAFKIKIGESSSLLSIEWKAEHVSSGDVVSVKQVYANKQNNYLKSCSDYELNFLSSVNNPNIIRLYDSFQVSPSIEFLIFDLDM